MTQAHTAIIRANESLAGRNGGKAGPVIVRNGKSAKAKAKKAKSDKGKPAPPPMKKMKGTKPMKKKR